MKKQSLRMGIDVGMTLFLLLAFGYQQTGSQVHEIIGIGTFVLSIIHNILNIRWYKVLFIGKYNIRRIISTIANFLMLLCVLFVLISGIFISRDLFAFLGLNGGFGMRQIHTFTAYWGLILISIHLGLHWSTILKRVSSMIHLDVPAFLVRTSAIIFAVCGVWSSFQLGIGNKLLMKDTFSYWDGSPIFFYFSWISVIGLYVFITHYFLSIRFIRKGGKSE